MLIDAVWLLNCEPWHMWVYISALIRNKRRRVTYESLFPGLQHFRFFSDVIDVISNVLQSRKAPSSLVLL